MKIRLVQDARIKHYAGEIVDVSAEEFNFLTSVGSGVPVLTGANLSAPETSEEAKTKPKRKSAKRGNA